MAKWGTHEAAIEEQLIMHTQGCNVLPRVQHAIPQGSGGVASVASCAIGGTTMLHSLARL